MAEELCRNGIELIESIEGPTRSPYAMGCYVLSYTMGSYVLSYTMGSYVIIRWGLRDYTMGPYVIIRWGPT